MTFQEAGLNKNILKAIEDLGFESLTPIQQEAVPYLLENETDLIALAQTGTGKTAAFGLPVLHKINIERKLPQAIILCPTRELCLQISKDITSYSKYIKGLKVTPVYGGASIIPQIKSLKAGTQIIVGTPGRVIDLINRKSLKLQNIEFVILDEADEMLNMGFKDDLDTILAETPEEKQTLLFSATMPKEVMKISKNYMFSPKTIEVASRNEGAKDVDHHYYMVNARDRYKALRRICDVNPDIYGIVFCRTRRETADVADKLMQDGYNADAIHGELSQAQRDHVMGRFRQRKLQILVATDVAARGIDINELTHVINYNLPDDNEIYVHRSGRTGRAGNKGISIIIAHSRDGRKLKAIEKMIKRKLTLKKVPNGDEICQIQLMKLIDKVVDTKVNHQIEKYLPSIEEKLAHLEKEELIKHFVSTEFNRFLSFYKNAPDLNVSGSKKREQNENTNIRKSKGKRTGHAEEGHTRFFINIGKEKNLQTHNLIGLINEYTRNRNIPVGKIDIMRKFSFFEISTEFEGDILSGMSDANWNGNKINVEISQAPGKKNSRGAGKRGGRKFSAKRKKTSRKSTSRRTLLSREGSSKSSKGSSTSFKSRFNAAAKRKRI
ncbi:MAG: DEAD/DEAH box helicase [Flavobacteriales bacterium]|nr:DEAD/DEAH box helicase [Flavobacteriales bacterium]|tara:strand:+ start:56148 stop:57974 length:1827 start_codon:yes stop_codon:yes gene_type:complete